MKSFSQYLTEARRNPEQNPKISVNDQFAEYYDKFKKGSANIDTHYISMTKLDKLGINPRSEYDTPLGIYSYPFDYVHTYADDMVSELPFVSDAPYVNIFKIRPGKNVVRLDNLSDGEFYKLRKFLIDAYVKQFPKDQWKEQVDRAERIVLAAPEKAKFKSNGGQLWYISRELSDRRPIKWNGLMRAAGIDGCVDYGEGIIHTSETTQAVFFSMDAIEIVDRLKNDSAKDPHELRVMRGEEIKAIKARFDAMSVEEQKEAVNEAPFDIIYAKKLPEDFLIQFFKENGSMLLRYSDDAELPSRLHQSMVKADPENIKRIKRPSAEIQRLAVSSGDGSAIKFIKNPTEETQLLAISKHSYNLRPLLQNKVSVSKKVLRAAIEEDEYSVRTMQDYNISIPEDLQMLAVRKEPRVFQFIDTPAPAVMKYVVSKLRKDPQLINSFNSEYQGKIKQLLDFGAYQ